MATISEVIPDLELPERVRMGDEPVFMKPSEGDPLPNLMTILSMIPLAKKVMTESGVLLENYGENSEWWRGASVGTSTDRPELDWNASQEEEEEHKAFIRSQDDLELLWETQRLMAFMHGSERLYGSVQALANLPAMENSPEVSTDVEPIDNMDKFLMGWSHAMQIHTDDPEAQLFRIEIGTKGGDVAAWVIDLGIDPDAGGNSLYDKLDWMLWYQYEDNTLDEEKEEEEDTASKSPHTDMALWRAPPILVMRVRSMRQLGVPLDVEVPATLWLDRYMAENKDAAKKMRSDALRIRRSIRRIDERIDKLEMVGGQRHKQTRQWVNAEEGGVPTALELLGTSIAYLDQKKVAEESDDANPLSPLSGGDDLDFERDLLTDTQHAKALADKLRDLKNKLETELVNLKQQKAELHEESEKVHSLLKPADTIVEDWTASGPMDTEDGEESSRNVRSAEPQQPKYKYSLRGVSVNSRNVCLRLGGEGDWPQWHRINWEVDQDVVRQVSINYE
jgi:hypothetical protein